ncbi:MAG: T9SS type A sorting domain-containing protein [Bacteroidota bacterium]
MQNLSFNLSLFLVFWSAVQLSAQNYVNYFTGNPQDKVTDAQGGVCLMGGSREDDQAMKWFLKRANGGDVLVLRASGSDGYNNYLFSELGVPVNSVETIVFKDASASQEAYIQQKIKQAEAIWLAGGNQWKYVSYWRDSPVAELINQGIQERNLTIGGTSAGMAILCGLYFSSEYGTISTEDALQNPLDRKVFIDTTPFIQLDYLQNVITDTHYAERDRQGRQVAFMAYARQFYQSDIRGIACDERTAVCIDPEGRAYVYGSNSADNGNAYFLQTNCEANHPAPETYIANQSLEWNADQAAIKVYRVKGTPEGNPFFDLKQWQDGDNGTWLDWSVRDGRLFQKLGNAPACNLAVNTNSIKIIEVQIFPNPGQTEIRIQAGTPFNSIEIRDTLGRMVNKAPNLEASNHSINSTDWAPGAYFIYLYFGAQPIIRKIIKQ